MNRIVITGLSILFCISKVLGSPNDDGTAMLMAAQPDSPAVLVQTTHSKTDFLSAAQLKNVGDRTITGYRIGWVVVFTSGKSEVTMGRPTNVPAGINPGEIAEVDAQGVSPRLAEQGAATVLFFVTDIHLANSKVWKADIKSIRQEAEHSTPGQQ